MVPARAPVLHHPITTQSAALRVSMMNKRASTATIIIRTIISCPKNSHGPLNPYDANRTYRVSANHMTAIPMTESVSIVRACDDRQTKRNSKRCQQYHYLSHINLLINNDAQSVSGNNRSAILACCAAGLKPLPGFISHLTRVLARTTLQAFGFNANGSGSFAVYLKANAKYTAPIMKMNETI